MANLLRRIVSGHKRRWQADGFDLDLAYVAPRIVAMGLPAQGTEALYRNRVADAARFLRAFHAGHARVFNLCSEHAYDAAALGVPPGALCHALPFDDHQVPGLAACVQFCADASAWLAANPANVVVIHCKAGKGRSGIMACCLLLHLHSTAPELANLAPALAAAAAAAAPAAAHETGGTRASEHVAAAGPTLALPQQHPWRSVAPVQLRELASPVQDVLALYAQRRTHDGNGVTIASQRRWVGYFWCVLCSSSGTDSTLPPPRAVQLRHVVVSGLPPGGAQGCELLVEARPSGSTAPRGSLVCVRSAPKAAAALAGSAALCVPCMHAPAVQQQDSSSGGGSCCTITSSAAEGDSLSFTLPAASLGLRPLGSSSGGEAEPDDGSSGSGCLVEGDVRVTLARAGERLFFTWLHTSFLPPGGRVVLPRSQLDKPAKSLPHRLSVTVAFARAAPSAEGVDSDDDGAATAAGQELHQHQQQQQLQDPWHINGASDEQRVAPASSQQHQPATRGTRAGAASAPVSPQGSSSKLCTGWRQPLPSISSISTSAVLFGSEDAAAAADDCWALLAGSPPPQAQQPHQPHQQQQHLGSSSSASLSNWGSWCSTSWDWGEWGDSLAGEGGGDVPRDLNPTATTAPAPQLPGGTWTRSSWRLPLQPRPTLPPAAAAGAAAAAAGLAARAPHRRRHSSGLEEPEGLGVVAIELPLVGSRQQPAQQASSTVAALLDLPPHAGAAAAAAAAAAGSLHNQRLRKATSWSGSWFAAASAAVPQPAAASAASGTRSRGRSRSRSEGGGALQQTARAAARLADDQAPLLLLEEEDAPAPEVASPPADAHEPAAADPLHGLLAALNTWGADARCAGQMPPLRSSSSAPSSPLRPRRDGGGGSGWSTSRSASLPHVQQPHPRSLALPAAGGGRAAPAAARPRLPQPPRPSAAPPGLHSLPVPSLSYRRSKKKRGQDAATARLLDLCAEEEGEEEREHEERSDQQQQQAVVAVHAVPEAAAAAVAARVRPPLAPVATEQWQRLEAAWQHKWWV